MPNRWVGRKQGIMFLVKVARFWMDYGVIGCAKGNYLVFWLKVGIVPDYHFLLLFVGLCFVPAAHLGNSKRLGGCACIRKLSCPFCTDPNSQPQGLDLVPCGWILLEGVAKGGLGENKNGHKQ